MERMYVQCHLEDGTSRMVAALPWERGLRKGVRVTLKDAEDPERLWTVAHVGAPMPRSRFKTDWHNNI
jgi:hypothetical protein